MGGEHNQGIANLREIADGIMKASKIAAAREEALLAQRDALLGALTKAADVCDDVCLRANVDRHDMRQLRNVSTQARAAIASVGEVERG